jgi:hypothetical protein
VLILLKLLGAFFHQVLVLDPEAKTVVGPPGAGSVGEKLRTAWVK